MKERNGQREGEEDVYKGNKRRMKRRKGLNEKEEEMKLRKEGGKEGKIDKKNRHRR